nr:MAG TPA: Chromatin remodeling complex ATPase [Caudoviricetes sp.]
MYTLMEHQKTAIFMMDANPSLGCFYAPGLGKTAIALHWTLAALKDGRIEDALIVCPASLVPNWQANVDKMAMFEGVTPSDVTLLKDRVAIRSFQKTYRVSKRVVHHKNGKESVKKDFTLRDDVDKLWGAVMIDESQGIGSYKSRQTKACLTLARLAKYRYIFSGTPISGSTKAGGKDYAKLYGQLNFLHPGLFPTWAMFCKDFVTSYDNWGKPRRYNEPACEGMMAEYAIAARLEDCVDMPDRTETVIPCELEEKKVYKDVLEGRIEQYGIELANAGGQYRKVLQVCSGSLKRETDTLTLKTSKDAVLADIIDGTDDKIVVFCNFRASIDRCKAICEDKMRKTVVFDGRSAGPTWKEFQEGDADAIVLQYQAGGAGLDLYAGHTMVFYEPTLSALLLEQAKARIYRKGQTQKCLYYYLSTPDSLESDVLDSVRNGVEVTDDVLCRLAHGRLRGRCRDELPRAEHAEPLVQ